MVLGLDGAPLPAVDAATVAGLPRLGRTGVLMDLEYADLSTADSGIAVNPEVWLGRDAPKDAIARLAAEGIVVTGLSTEPDVTRELDNQGASLAIWFHVFAALIGGALAVASLAMVGGVDRRPRADELSALRVQGVAARTVARAATRGYVALSVAAGVVGLGAGALAWWLSGAYMPIFTEVMLWPAPRWPSALSVGWPWISAVIVLTSVALGVGLSLRRAVARR
jgi:hypothetical protein